MVLDAVAAGVEPAQGVAAALFGDEPVLLGIPNLERKQYGVRRRKCDGRFLFKARDSASAAEKELATCCSIQKEDKQVFRTDSRRYVSRRQALAKLISVEEFKFAEQLLPLGWQGASFLFLCYLRNAFSLHCAFHGSLDDRDMVSQKLWSRKRQGNGYTRDILN